MSSYGWTRLLIGIVATVVVAGVAQAGGPGELRDALRQRYTSSRMEVQNVTRAGAVVRPGTVLRLETGAVPAKRLRFIQASPKSPRFHVRDYARVEIAGDRVLAAERGDFALQPGARVVVLDLKVDRDRVRLFTHTAEPVALPTGRAEYGCTEFVFRLDPDVIQRADAATIAQAIERWLARAA